MFSSLENSKFEISRERELVKYQNVQFKKDMENWKIQKNQVRIRANSKHKILKDRRKSLSKLRSKSQKVLKRVSNMPQLSRNTSTPHIKKPLRTSYLNITPSTKSKSKDKAGASHKQMNNLADLNFFIKTIEKDLVKNMSSTNSSSFPPTPSSIAKRLDE